MKVPAAFPPSDENYRGPIIFNPGMRIYYDYLAYADRKFCLLGGPGGSVVDYINIHGDQMQAVFGTEYDILGFDPRFVQTSWN